MVLRWLAGLGVLGTGLYGLLMLMSNWSALAEQAIILPSYAPVRLLPAVTLKIAAGVAILLRTRWCIALAAAWTAAWVYWAIGDASASRWPWQFLAFSLVEQCGLLAFLVLLWLRGRLK